MQTMSALLRIGGSLEMTVLVNDVTPAEAWLLMHVHDPATRDAFEEAVLRADVKRSKLDERTRLHERYPQQKALIEHLFPGRTAGDVPETFDELQDTPLDVAVAARQTKRERGRRAQVDDAPTDAGDEFVARAPSTLASETRSPGEVRPEDVHSSETTDVHPPGEVRPEDVHSSKTTETQVPGQVLTPEQREQVLGKRKK